MRQLVAIDLAGDDLLDEHRPGFKADHLIAILTIGHVHDDNMRMQMRVEFARCMFGEAREDQPPGGLVDDLAIDPVPQGSMFLEIVERRADGLLMSSEDTFVAHDQGHDRDGLRRVDREVPSGMMLDLPPGTVTAELKIANLPGEQVLQDVRFDLPLEPEFGGDLAAPLRMLVGALGVVVADRIVAADIGGLALEADGIDHAGVAEFRSPSWRPCCRSRNAVGFP